MKIALVQSPAWIIETPPYNLALIKSFLSANGYECVCIDLNIGLFNYYKNTSKDEDWFMPEARSRWQEQQYVLSFFEKYRPFIDACVKKIIDVNPFVIGFTAQYDSLYFSVYIAREIKKISPGTAIIFGGPACYRNCKGREIMESFPWIDTICWGESERCLLEMLSIIEKKGTVDFCRGFAFRDSSGNTVDCGDAEILENLDTLPFADFSDFQLEKYTDKKLPIVTSRGCIYKCVFCNEMLHWKRYRCRSAENVYSEIEYQLKKNPHIQKVFFNDLLINGNIRVLNELCDLLIKNPLKVSWSGQASVRKEMTEEFLRKLRRSGCDTLIYGIESGSDKILRLMGKASSGELAEQCLRNTYNAYINVNFNIIVGFPGEGEEEFLLTVEFLKRNIKYANFIAISLFYINKHTNILDRKDFFNVEALDSPDWHIFWNTKDRKNTYEERLRRLRILKSLCEDRAFWNQAKVKNKGISQKYFNTIASPSEGPIDSVTVKVYDDIQDVSFSPEVQRNIHLAKDYKEKDKFKDAIAELKKNIRRYPHEPQSLCLLSEIYMHKKNYAFAEEMLNRAIASSPQISWPYRVFGVLYFEKGKQEKARHYLNIALKFADSDDDEAQTYFDIARSYIAEQKIEKACEYLRKAVRIRPENHYYKDFLEKLYASK